MDASSWDERYRAADRLWPEGPNLFVADRLGEAEPGAGVDVGSGEGRNAVWLAERGWDMTAVDFSEVAVERGRASSDEVRFAVADVLAWDPPRSYDLALVAYLHLEPEPMATLVDRVRSWLSPGGELFLIGHDRSNLDHGHGGPQAPELLHTVDAALEWLDGMEIVEAQVVRRPVRADGTVVYARDSLVRARASPRTGPA